MLTISLQKSLEDAIELSHFTKGLSSVVLIAEDVYDSNPELMEQAKRPVLILRIRKMIENRRARVWSKNEPEKYQLTLPGFEGLPRRIVLPNGQRKLLDDSTAKDVQRHIAMLRKRFLEHPKIQQMERVLDLMQKHNSQKPRITWSEVKAIELKF